MRTILVKNVFAFFILLFFQNVQTRSQGISKPIKWDFILPTDYKIGDTLSVFYRAKIEKNWNMYSFDCDSIEYVQPAKFTIVSDESFGVISPLEFSKPTEIFDKVLERKIRIFTKEVLLIQKILVKKKVLNFASKIDYYLVKDEDESGSVLLLSETF